ncbi:hypothetical protein B6S09_14655 [Oceanimonas baumannii]|uniref:Uncharacterized protein n=1 Tax=Oceanimonas baumannii TaxID=129578 RepID=A0A235CE34_9GAMM|nr:hypothetical protein B6S09_14655 [Oceanimonas baumannii]TDW57671.1 hypothetical protein LY04_02536 [Oceanimonas baumannii]
MQPRFFALMFVSRIHFWSFLVISAFEPESILQARVQLAMDFGMRRSDGVFSLLIGFVLIC